MRIVQVTASVAESDGGATTAVLGMDEGYRSCPEVSTITLTTDADGYRGRLPRSERERLDATRPTVRVHPRSRPLRIKNSWALRTALNREVAQADLVHIHGVYLAHTVWAFLAARRHRRRYIVQPHGALEPYQAQFGRLHKATWDRVVGHRILNGAAALVATSEDEAKNLRSLLPDARVIVMPLGTSPGASTVPDHVRDSVAVWLSAPRHQRVLFLGRLARKKRPELLIDAWNRLDEGVLAVVGPDDHWTSDALRERVSSHRRHSVYFPGAVDAEGVRWFMQKAGVFVLPSENENFGLTVAEAMMGGAAVVTTRQTAAAEFVHNARAGILLKTPNVAALTTAMSDLITNQLAVAAAGQRGREYASHNLTWNASVSQLLGSLPESRFSKTLELPTASHLRAQTWDDRKTRDEK